VDSSAAGADSSSATAALGSSSSQVKSVDFLQSTQLVVNQVRLPNHMYYLGKIFTYRLDRTTVTVRAPRMLAMSTSPASAGAFSLASVVVGSSATASRLSSPLNNWGLTRQLRHEFFHGGGWVATGSSRLSHRIPVTFVPLVYGVGRRNLLQATEFRRQHTQHRETSTRLPYSKSSPLGRWSP
jgi:hypothetical protein